jgi:DNA-binding PadR family transcriptional regulator
VKEAPGGSMRHNDMLRENGKRRKYYVLTRRGGVALGDARKKIRELVGEVLEAGSAKGGMKVRKVAALGMRRRGQGGVR